ncbi:MAG: DUF2892 domain-containing protein [Bacteroidetes bacterium]|nr:DUF2892 domain-containing protein [Bacteroidota bacterium]
MKNNVGMADRIIRIIVAILFSVLFFTGTVSGTLGMILLILGGVFFATALVGFCPIYALVGMNTCPPKKG